MGRSGKQLLWRIQKLRRIIVSLTPGAPLNWGKSLWFLSWHVAFRLCNHWFCPTTSQIRGVIQWCHFCWESVVFCFFCFLKYLFNFQNSVKISFCFLFLSSSFPSLPSFFSFFFNLLPIFPNVKNPRKLFLLWKVEDLPKLSITFYDTLGAHICNTYIAVLWCLPQIVGAGIKKNCLLHLFIS